MGRPQLNLDGKDKKDVYFIQINNWDVIKIGSAYDPQKRFKAIRIAMPYETELVGIIKDGGNETEKYLHRCFRKYRIRRGGVEWFKGNDEMRKEISEILAHPEEIKRKAEKFKLLNRLRGERLELEGKRQKIVKAKRKSHRRELKHVEAELSRLNKKIIELRGEE